MFRVYPVKGFVWLKITRVLGLGGSLELRLRGVLVYLGRRAMS
jgi:hypothetical protein